MLLLIFVFLALTAVGLATRLRVPGGVNAANLGSMSDRWLSEYRASHGS